MLSSVYDVYDVSEIEEIEELPMAAEYDMPRQNLGGIGDFFGKVLDIGTSVVKNYAGLTQPQPMQAPPQYVAAPSPQQVAYRQSQQQLLQMPYTVMPYRSAKQPSFFEENALPIIGISGLAVLLVIVARRK